ncbi:hypothetical protein [Mycobacterium leprae]
MSFVGASVSPAWVHNLEANPTGTRRDRGSKRST